MKTENMKTKEKHPRNAKYGIVFVLRLIGHIIAFGIAIGIFLIIFKNTVDLYDYIMDISIFQNVINVPTLGWLLCFFAIFIPEGIGATYIAMSAFLIIRVISNDRLCASKAILPIYTAIVTLIYTLYSIPVIRENGVCTCTTAMMFAYIATIAILHLQIWDEH